MAYFKELIDRLGKALGLTPKAQQTASSPVPAAPDGAVDGSSPESES
jgi:hypothetical protein